jgi:hypothetical protein
MFALILRNSSIRSLPLLLFKGALLSFAVLGVYSFSYLHRHSPSLAFEVTTIWLILAFYLTIGKTNQRCTLLDLSLPIEARTLWLSHFLSLITAGVIMLVVSGGILVAGTRLISRLHSQALHFERDLLSASPHMIAGLTLAVAVLQTRSHSLFRIPGNERNRLITAASLAGILVILLLIVDRSPVWILLLLAAAFALAYWNYRSVPSSYSIFPLQANGAATTFEDARTMSGDRRFAKQEYVSGRPIRPFEHKRLLLRMMLQCFMKIEGLIKIPGIGFFVMSFLFLWGVLISGFLMVWKMWEDDLRFTFLFITAYVLFSGLRAQMKQMVLLDPLPIARSTIFAVLILPLLFAIMIGYGAGSLGIVFLDKSTEAIEFFECDGYFCTRIPFEFCEITWHAPPPANASPWGESHEPWSRKIFAGGRFAVYSPFSTMRENSADFAALQISRAVEAIYGASIPPQEINDRYFVVEEGRVTSLKEGGLTLQKDYPELERRGGGPFFPIFFLLMGWVWMAMVGIYMRTFRAGIQERTRIAVFISLMAVSFLLHFLPFAGAISKIINLNALIGFSRVLIRESADALPGGDASIWIICFLLFWAAYRLAQGQFCRAEIAYRREIKNE